MSAIEIRGNDQRVLGVIRGDQRRSEAVGVFSGSSDCAAQGVDKLSVAVFGGPTGKLSVGMITGSSECAAQQASKSSALAFSLAQAKS